MDSLLAYNRDEDVDTEQVPFAFAGMAGKQVNRNPFRRLRRDPYVLKSGAMFFISERPAREFGEWMETFVTNLSNQYASIPYDDRVRKIYAKHYRRDGMTDLGMVLHYWTHRYQGLEFTLLDLKSADLRIGFVYGKDAPVNIVELLSYAYESIPNHHPLKKRFLAFLTNKPDNNG